MGITHVEEKKLRLHSLSFIENPLSAKSLIERGGRGGGEGVTSNLQGPDSIYCVYTSSIGFWFRTDVAWGGRREREEERRNREEKNERDTLVFGPFCSKEEKVMGGGEEGVKRAAARRNSSLALIALGGLLSIMSGNRWLTQFPAARFVWPA